MSKSQTQIIDELEVGQKAWVAALIDEDEPGPNGDIRVTIERNGRPTIYVRVLPADIRTDPPTEVAEGSHLRYAVMMELLELAREWMSVHASERAHDIPMRVLDLLSEENKQVQS